MTKEEFEKFPKWAKFIIRRLNTWRFQLMIRNLMKTVEDVLRYGTAEQIRQAGEKLANNSNNNLTKPIKYIGEQMVIEAEDLVARRNKTGEFKLMGNPEKWQELIEWLTK